MTTNTQAQAARLAVVSAGLSEPSSTRLLADRLAGATRSALAEQGVEAEVTTVELRDVATEIAHNFTTGFPGGALRGVIESVTGADGLIAVTPVFSASYSGLFKSFFDVLDNDALTGKPVLLGATGGTPRHSLVLEHAMRPLFAYLRTVTVPTAVYAATDDWAASDDGLTPSLPGRIARAGGELAALVAPRTGAAARQPQAAEEEVVPFEQQLAALRVEE
ncbi:FMN reductase [Streptomyces albus]|uniref:Oxidoreductase n=1 Tax=Streptomyces albus TaxID=1888 RepID=A0A6C1BZH4_9ACTN|nr:MULTISPECIES: FMN reductase [Streptomyces]EPD95552.1 CE1759 family LLM-partnered FMN reductase [Streptomyces sp. HPH0547]MDI6407763.1 FMN reductase [Streptomyces albus]QID36084.1 FMN reductase [Streptomyces albus]TGG89415.1 oxidoreductase [Streptomyces albus]UVN57114.1 FMN reductase [Streptomyces albus]